jgi:hypothetical protein
MKKLKKCWPFLIASALWSLFYLPRLPVAIQGGDTPELATAAALLIVPHPPGYPLYIWLLRLGNFLLQGPSPYWESAFTTSLFSLAGMILLLFLRPDRPIVSLVLTISLALSSVFWHFSLLPDVFALHWFFIILSCFVFLTNKIKSEEQRLWWLSLVLGASFANHHTTLFLFPLWLFQIKAVRNARTILLSLGCGALISACFYLSIFLFDRNHILSWGNIENISDLWRHFTRADYGTFSLAATNHYSEYWVYQGLFWKSFFQESAFFWSALILGLVFQALSKRKTKPPVKDPRLAAILGCFFFYTIVFFCLSNIAPRGFGHEVFKRFLGTPFVLLVIYGIARFDDSYLNRMHFFSRNVQERFRVYFGVFLIAASLISGWYRNGLQLDFSNRRIIEELSVNYVRQKVPNPNKPTFVTAMSDSTLFALYYVLGVLKVREDFFLFNPGALHVEWYQKLIKKHFPQVNFTNIDLNAEGRMYSMKDFIRDNQKEFNFLVEQDVSVPNFGLQYGVIGRFVKEGLDTEFVRSTDLIRTVDWSSNYVPDYTEYNTELGVYSKYAHYYLAQGLKLFEKRKLKEAVESFEKGLEEVPYCLPCLANKCYILSAASSSEHQGCFELLKKMQANYFNYYSGQPFQGVESSQAGSSSSIK